MDKVTVIVARILGVFLSVLMAAMVLDVTWQVFTRFVLKDPSPFTEELAGFLLIWIGLLGASYAYYTRAHLGIDVLTARLSGGCRRATELAIQMIVLLFALSVMVIGGIRLVNLTFTLNQVSPALGLKMGYVYLMVPISGMLIIFFALGFIVKILGGKPLEEAKESVALD